MTELRPDLDASERALLEQSLDAQRDAVVRRCIGMDDGQLAAQPTPSTLSLAGLLKHLALVEDHWFCHMLLGRDVADEWRGIDWESDPDWEFRTARDETGETLLARYRAACDASREAVSSFRSLDDLSVGTTRSGRRFKVRWVLQHMVTETARHAGHADIIREAIDGATGV